MGLLALALGAAACGARAPQAATPAPGGPGPAAERQEAAMRISSPAFEPGGGIPVKYTCDGQDLAPPLAWSGVPASARSLALVCDDPDAPVGTWVHWVVVNVPPDAEGLPEGGALPDGAAQVENDFGRGAYGGPCPPGGTHRYFFRLYALDVPALSGLTRDNFSARIREHVLTSAELMGVYTRRR